MLIRRIHAQCKQRLCCIGTSATLVSVGSKESQQSEVASVASTIFGRPFKSNQVVVETLAQSLDVAGTGMSGEELSKAIANGVDPEAEETAIVSHPVAVWLENRIALEDREGHVARRKPMTFSSVVAALADDSGAPRGQTQQVLEAILHL